MGVFSLLTSSGWKKQRDRSKVGLAPKRVFRLGFLEKWYPLPLFILGIIILLLQGIEHFTLPTHDRLFFISEALILIVLISLAIVLTQRLRLTIEEKKRAIQLLEAKNELGQKLLVSKDVSEISDSLAEELATLNPVSALALFVYDRKKSHFTLVNPGAENIAAGLKWPGRNQLDSRQCALCLSQNGVNKMREIDGCPQLDGFRLQKEQDGYCLPLTQSDSPVGLVFLFSPKQHGLTPDQLDLMEKFSPEISFSIAMTIENKLREKELLSNKVSSTQFEIARDLHDTIGQNISYLRMKLDQLSEMDLSLKHDIDQDIHYLLEVANESYDLVRGTLAVLQTGTQVDLNNLLKRYSAQIEDRSSILVRFSTTGDPVQLEPYQMRQLFLVFREALNNCEKYAQASQINIEMNWEEENLTLSFSDDGRGFDLTKVDEKYHFGIRFMRERVAAIQGFISIQSTPGRGTNITIIVPYQKTM